MHDLCIVGAGPAGMAAAGMAAGLGLSVALLDEQPGPGGQIYRSVTAGGPTREAILGRDYLRGRLLAHGLERDGIDLFAGTTVWDIEGQGPFAVCHSRDGRAGVLSARCLILATGALERPVPVPGWTLPGVMTAGAAQILLKSSGLVPDRAVLAGAGPLLYLLAVQMARAGAPPLALVETCGRRDLIAALPRLPAALRGWRTLGKGMALLAALRRHGIRRHRGARDLRIEGGDRAEALVFEAGGRQQRIDCGTVLLHQGLVANTQITRALRLAHRWHEGQRDFVPETDAWGEASRPGIYVAGDGAGIDGAGAAEEAGRLAALAAAHRLGRIGTAERDAAARAPRARLLAERAVRPFLDAAYPVPPAILRPADATPVCRCEEVTAGQLRDWARLGCQGPNQIKAYGRVGMGPCQGRYCGPTVTELLAEVRDRSPAEIGQFRTRPPFKPVTLGEIAALHGSGRFD
ncbi:MAG: NAD(P)/FAD-dependent oxidoreductase [Gemmobacter sp.]